MKKKKDPRENFAHLLSTQEMPIISVGLGMYVLFVLG